MPKRLKKPNECPKCGSRNVLYRRTDKMYWCRQCPAEWKAELAVAIPARAEVPHEEN